jgi:xylose isomerase
MDVLARGILIAEKMMNDGKLKKHIDDRYAGWDGDLGKKILGGKLGLAELSDHVLEKGLDPKPRSGRQEFLENLVQKYL